MLINRKTQYYQKVSSSQTHLQISCNSNKNPSMFFCGYQHTDSKVYMERQKTQNSQYNTEREQS